MFFFFFFFFLRVVSPSTLVSYFFLQLQAKKKNPDVLGILIIRQHCFTVKFFLKKYVLSIFIPKILPTIQILFRSNFFHDFIILYLRKRGKNKNPRFIDFYQIFFIYQTFGLGFKKMIHAPKKKLHRLILNLENRWNPQMVFIYYINK